MQMDAIVLFRDVAYHRSISKAAVAHGVTQSAASQRIRALEKELSVTLVDRSTRPLQLTAAGELYHRGCRRILEQHEQLKRQIKATSLPLEGEVTAASIYSAGIEWLSGAKDAFEQAYSEVTVRVSYLRPQLVYDRVCQEQADFGILSYPECWHDVTAIPMRSEPMAVVARPSHPVAAWKGVHASALEGWPLVSFEMALPIGRKIHAYLRHHAVTPRYANLFDNIDTIKTFVSETETLAILPEPTVHREVDQGTLVTVPLEPELVRPLAVVYPRQRELRPVVQRFVEHLSNHQPSLQKRSAEAAVPA